MLILTIVRSVMKDFTLSIPTTGLYAQRLPVITTAKYVKISSHARTVYLGSISTPSPKDVVLENVKNIAEYVGISRLVKSVCRRTTTTSQEHNVDPVYPTVCNAKMNCSVRFVNLVTIPMLLQAALILAFPTALYTTPTLRVFLLARYVLLGILYCMVIVTSVWDVIFVRSNFCARAPVRSEQHPSTTHVWCPL